MWVNLTKKYSFDVMILRSRKRMLNKLLDIIKSTKKKKREYIPYCVASNQQINFGVSRDFTSYNGIRLHHFREKLLRMLYHRGPLNFLVR